jgi:hypothetical protein
MTASPVPDLADVLAEPGNEPAPIAGVATCTLEILERGRIAPGRFAGRKVAIVCRGGNISPGQLTGLWPPLSG